MNTAFEIPTVGRAWCVLLGEAEAWFGRSTSGYLLGPFHAPSLIAEALCIEYRRWMSQAERTQAEDIFSDILPDAFIGVTHRCDQDDIPTEWSLWRILLRPDFTRKNEMFVLVGPHGVAKGRFVSGEEAVSALLRAQKERDVSGQTAVTR